MLIFCDWVSLMNVIVISIGGETVDGASNVITFTYFTFRPWIIIWTLDSFLPFKRIMSFWVIYSTSQSRNRTLIIYILGFMTTILISLLFIKTKLELAIWLLFERHAFPYLRAWLLISLCSLLINFFLFLLVTILLISFLLAI